MSAVILGTTTTEPPLPPPPPRLALTKLRCTLIGPSGDRLSLDEGGIKVLRAGVEGLGRMRPDMIESRSPGIHGTFVYPDMPVSYPARDVFLPLALDASGLGGLADLRDRLEAVSNPLLGPTRLETALGGREPRTLTGYRIDADPAWDSDTWSVRGHQRIGLLIHCPDPWGRSPSIVKTWKVGTPVLFFPIFPLVISSSERVGNANTVILPGKAPSYPGWVMVGPLATVTATNLTTGRSWALDQPLLAEETLRVFTDPRDTHVEGPAGLSAWAKLAPPFDLWPLAAGENSIRVDMTGATTIDSSVTMTVDPLWDSML